MFARTQTRSEADAEDVLQDAIVEAARKSHGAPPDLPLVYATLRRRAMDLAAAPTAAQLVKRQRAMSLRFAGLIALNNGKLPDSLTRP